MNKDEMKQFLLGGVARMRGDDLYRAKSAFQNCTLKQMGEEHGESGMTRQQVLDGYQKNEDKCDEAVRFINSL